MYQADYKFSQHYLDILKDHFEGLNLTRIQKLELFHVEQFQDSIAPLERCKEFKKALEGTNLLIDIGFGGGFPILPLAYRCPEKIFVGFEGRGKKVAAVKKIAARLNLKNTSFFHRRIEEVEVDRPCVMTFRAVGKIQDCLRSLFLSAPCRICLYKGPNLEKKERGWWWEKKDWRLLEDTSFSVGHVSRRCIILENIHVPHGTFGKNLVKLSSFL